MHFPPDVNWSAVRRANSISRFHVHKQLDPNVATLRLFPGITASTVRAFLAPPMQGVVLETYGAGNVPSSRKDILGLIGEACARGVVVVNCTQCKRGLVSDLYETGKVLLELGVIAGRRVAWCPRSTPPLFDHPILIFFSIRL